MKVCSLPRENFYSCWLQAKTYRLSLSYEGKKRVENKNANSIGVGKEREGHNP